jgi:mannose-6-phosphate isomerase-like protein (cupin superfamily)
MGSSAHRPEPATPGWTLRNLDQIEDVAARRTPDGSRQLRFGGKALGLSQVGMSHQRLGASVRQPIGHRHTLAEEVVYVAAGSGRARLDDEVVDIAAGDLLRVGPEVMRSFEAGEDGIEMLVFSQKIEADEGEIVRDWWQD